MDTYDCDSQQDGAMNHTTGKNMPLRILLNTCGSDINGQFNISLVISLRFYLYNFLEHLNNAINLQMPKFKKQILYRNLKISKQCIGRENTKALVSYNKMMLIYNALYSRNLSNNV